MLRSAASKVMWVGRATVFMVGLAVILALVLGAASAAFGANGDFFKVGRDNFASAVSVLDKSGAGPALRLLVDSGPPLAVNSSSKVSRLNADKLDGLDASQLGGLSGVTQVEQQGGVNDSVDSKTTSATCPDGTVAIAGGGRIQGFTNAAAIDESRRDFGDPRTWVVGAHEPVPTNDVWSLGAFAICATARP
jgi:hypothetical protein